MGTRTRLMYAGLALFSIGGLLGAAAALAADSRVPPPATTGPAAESGKVVGLLLGRTDNDIKIKPEGASEPQIYALAAPGGTADPRVAAAVKGAFPPNVVAVEWKLQAGQKVLTSFRQLLRPERNGAVIGTVMGKSALARRFRMST